jgi:predicted ATPase
LKDQVEAWISEISSGNKICITPNEDIGSSSPQSSFEIKNHNSKKYHSTNVGFGISSTLPIVVALLASPPGSLIIIEHPEGHLHPSGQTKIGKLISLAASSGIQVIIETHSDHILNGIRVSVHGGLIKPDDIQFNHFQRREKQNQVVTEVISPRIDRNGRIDRWPDGFFDEIENSLTILLAPAEH